MIYNEIPIIYKVIGNKGFKFCPICGYKLKTVKLGNKLIRTCINPEYPMAHLYYNLDD